MSITTSTWSVAPNGLLTATVNGNENTVLKVRYVVTATDNVNVVQISNMVDLPPNTSSDYTFIPFANLEPATVIGWVQAAIPANQLQQIQTVLGNMLTTRANPPTRPTPQSLPWGQ
jgi:hypothetical protein